MPQIKQAVFKDIPLSFTAHPLTGQVKMLENADAVKRSVRNIVLTNFYGRPYKPNYGGNVTQYLFENFDPITEYNIVKNITIALDNYEPRAIVDAVVVKASVDQNALDVTVIFRIRNQEDAITAEITLERLR